MSDNEMRETYDFSKGVKGKYVHRYREGVNIVKIDDDLGDIFPDEASVNEALRALAPLLRERKSD